MSRAAGSSIPSAGRGASERAEALLDAFGLGGGRGNPRLAWRLVLAILLFYALSFAAFYPRVITNSDELQYINQAQLVLRGHPTVTKTDPFTGETSEIWPSTYSVGSAFLMAPFVWAVGWRGAYLVPCLGLLLAVGITARWLQQEGRSPGFALLLLGFPASLVMGRVAMSDTPSAALVALGLWLFWRGLDRGWPSWLASGFIAGASVSFRITNALPFVPFFAGSVLRREKACWALVVGGLAGLAVRLIGMDYYFGDLLFERAYYYYSPDTLMERIPLFLFGLLVLVPGGLLLALAYRGRRRPELVVAVLLFVIFYLFQKFSSTATGLPKRVILALRYFLPLLPLLAFAMAESLPRLWQRLLEPRSPSARARLTATAGVLLALWIAGVAAAALAVHPVLARWGARQAEIHEAIHRHVADDAVLVTNWPATRKFLRVLDRRFSPVERDALSPEQAALLLERHGEFFIALIDRNDSAFWRRDAERNAAFVESFAGLPEPLLDRRVTATDRLRIWLVTRAVPD